MPPHAPTRDVEHGFTPANRRRVRKWRRAVPMLDGDAERNAAFTSLRTKLEKGSRFVDCSSNVNSGAYLEHLQSDFLQRSVKYEDLLIPRSRTQREKRLWVLRAIEHLYDLMTSIPDFSIAQAVHTLQTQSCLLAPADSDQERQHRCTELTFTLVASMSMLCIPRANPDILDGAHKLGIELGTVGSRAKFQSYARSSVDALETDRPLHDMMLGFGEMRPSQQDCIRDEESSILTLHFKRKILTTIGQIAIQWTMALPAHMDFDVATNTLFLFQMPTYCLLNITNREVSGEDKSVNTILDSCIGDMGTSTDYMKEVLLTTYIVLAQSSKARKLFQTPRILKKLDSTTLDPLLVTLCTSPWPFRDWSHQPKQRYVLCSDFPILGRKLEILHDHLNAKQPLSIWSMWKDKRNRLQWWTFWAVILIGGLALVFQIVQTALAGVQAYYSKCSR